MARAPLVILAAAGLISCSGAEAQDVLAPAPSDETTGAGTSSGGASSGGASSGGASSGGISDDAGGPSTECPSEREPNDDEEDANKLAPTLCGTIDPASDLDVLTFELAKGTTKMSIDFQGKVVLKVSVEGKDSVVLGDGESRPVPFVKGRPYFIEVRAIERGAKIPWRVDLIEK